MARTSVRQPYKWLALHYDQLFSSFRSPIDAARQYVLGRTLARVESACDLACGTGTTALTLANKGIKMFAVDQSPLMCRLAREKAHRAGVSLRVLCADMRRFRLPEAVDLITCEGDALNHIPRKTDLRLVAKAVARVLRPGGCFYFDVNNRAGFERYWSTTFWVEQPGVIVVTRNSNDWRHDRAWSDIELFIREGNLWRRRRDRIEEVCWSSSEIRRALRDAGFDRLRAWDAAPFFKENPLVRPGCRTVFLARKAFI